MTPSTRRNPLARSLAAGVTALSLVAVAACSDSTDDGKQPEPAFEGTYDSQAASELGDHQDQEVRITGEVRQMLSMYAFTLGESAEDEVLVVAEDGASDVQEGDTVEVAGTVRRGFDDLREVEQELGTEYGEAALAEWREEPYVLADTVAGPVEE